MQVALHYMLLGSSDSNTSTGTKLMNQWKRIHGIGSEDQGFTSTHNPVIKLIDVTFSAKHQSLAYTESSFQEYNWSCNRMDNPPASLPATPIVPPGQLWCTVSYQHLHSPMLLEALTLHFEPQRNITLERYPPAFPGGGRRCSLHLAHLLPCQSRVSSHSLASRVRAIVYGEDVLLMYW